MLRPRFLGRRGKAVLQARRRPDSSGRRPPLRAGSYGAGSREVREVATRLPPRLRQRTAPDLHDAAEADRMVPGLFEPITSTPSEFARCHPRAATVGRRASLRSRAGGRVDRFDPSPATRTRSIRSCAPAVKRILELRKPRTSMEVPPRGRKVFQEQLSERQTPKGEPTVNAGLAVYRAAFCGAARLSRDERTSAGATAQSVRPGVGTSPPTNRPRASINRPFTACDAASRPPSLSRCAAAPACPHVRI